MRRRLALIFSGAGALLALLTLILLALGAGEDTPADDFGLSGLGGLSFLVAALTFIAAGAVLITRVPDNPIGLILFMTGLLVAVGDFTFQYADYTLYISSDSLAGAVPAAWLQNLGIPPAFGLLGISLLLFPDGRLPSKRWRPALWLGVAGIAGVVIDYTFRPGALDAPFDNVSNPFGIPGSTEFMEALGALGWLLMAGSLVLAATSVVVRMRRAKDQERQQIKWIAVAAAGAGAAFVANVVTFFLSVEGIDQLRLVVIGLALAAFPIAAGIAILRYRLYDIDVVINRTLVYGALTATLAAVYLGSVLVFQLALSGLTSDSGLAVAGSTLAVAALFRPARARIQESVDRRFFRRRYDAARTLESSARLRDQVDLTALDAELQGVVSETMQPAHVSLWLRGS